MKALIGFIFQWLETSARLLGARELTVWYDKNWQTYWLAVKLVHSPQRILTSSGTYWHTDLFIIKDIVEHSVTIHFIIYWVIFAKLFNSLFYYIFIYLFVSDFYLILYMLICFRTLQMDQPELNFPLISACQQDQECPRFICQPITVSVATTPAVFANPH